MQGDGNLVVYSEDLKPMWASGTSGDRDKNSLVLQGDGNLVIYDNKSSLIRVPKWSSGTFPGAQKYDKPVMWSHFTDRPNKTKWVQSIDKNH